MSEISSDSIDCSSGINKYYNVLCLRNEDSILLLGHSQMYFSLDDARKLAKKILELMGDLAGDSLVDDICSEFQTKSKKGQQEYGQKMTRQDLSLEDWLRHMKEEMMDGVLYAEASLRRLKLIEDNEK